MLECGADRSGMRGGFTVAPLQHYKFALPSRPAAHGESPIRREQRGILQFGAGTFHLTARRPIPG
jgi:hypothetical protein